MNLTDTHCHLDFSLFDSCRGEVLQRAWQAGVSSILIPGVEAECWPRVLSLVASDVRFKAALGLHPCFISSHQMSDIDLLESHLKAGGLCAVGEIGLDLFIPEADLDEQLGFLLPQLALAEKYNLPVLLHVRKAHDQMLKVLRTSQLGRGGVVHAFSGSLQQAQQYLDLGVKLGMGGVVTYPRAKKVRNLVAQLPLQSFVLETDAPDMPLYGHQGELNEPVRVLDIAKTIAELRGCTVEEVAALTNKAGEHLN